MTFFSFIAIIILLLIVFQSLQIFFFRRKQAIVGGLFVLFFWSTFGFLVYSGFVLFSSNYQGQGNISPRTIVIEKGSSLTHISQQLAENGIIRSRDKFLWSANLLGLAKNMKAGKFVVVPTMSNYALSKLLTYSGNAVQERITIIEGITAKQTASLFAQKMDIDSVEFMKYVYDAEFINEHNIDAENLEGYLLPETYVFTYGITAREIVSTLVNHFKQAVADTLLNDIDSLGMTLHEVVTLASIIEGEAVLDDERTTISAVYHNRLNKGWRLQADPTIQYIIPDGPRRLLHKDLEIDSPYNTYRHKGLPPGPINNPGIMSIVAAVYPADETYLYFVAAGDGSHTFTHTQAEHLEAKKRLDRLRRQLRRNQ